MKKAAVYLIVFIMLLGGAMVLSSCTVQPDAISADDAEEAMTADAIPAQTEENAASETVSLEVVLDDLPDGLSSYIEYDDESMTLTEILYADGSKAEIGSDGHTTTLTEKSFTLTFAIKEGADGTLPVSVITGDLTTQVGTVSTAGTGEAKQNTEYEPAAGAEAEGTAADLSGPYIRVESVDIKPGETAQIHIDLGSNPGITALTLAFSYDTAKLSLDDVTLNEDLFGGQLTYAEKAVWLASGDTDADGTMLTLTVTAEPDAAGSTEISVSYLPGDICNYDEEDIDFTVIPGEVSFR